jgi:hypothetical protein
VKRVAVDLDQSLLRDPAANPTISGAQSADGINIAYTWEGFQRVHARRALDILRNRGVLREETAPREQGRTSHQSGKAKKFSSSYIGHVFLI